MYANAVSLLILSLVAACSCSLRSRSDSAKTVIVIGAGVSGTTAALNLAEIGFKVKVLEGRDRKGGRIFTDSSIFGYKVDLGAAWIHGIKKNPVTEVVDEENISLYKFNFDDAHYLSPSLKFDSDESADEKYNTIGKEFVDFVAQSMDQFHDTCLDMSIENILPYFLEAYPQNAMGENLAFLKSYLYYEFEGDYASKIGNLSAKNYETNERKGGDYLIPGGYWSIFDKRSEHKNIEYILNAKVIEVNQKDHWKKPFVILEDGNKYSAEYILVTVPLGVLKKNIIKFSPLLSPRKQIAINNLGFGSLEKVVVQFSHAFWKDFSLFKVIDNPVKFLSYAINYHKVSGKNTLIFLVGGEGQSFKKYYTASEEDFKKAILDTLIPLFPEEEIKIEMIHWTKWHIDPFSYGSYSSFDMNSSKSLVEEFSNNEDKVYFAGEHTHPTDFETVAGAYGSGIRAAKQIAKANELENQKYFKSKK